jgi:N-acetylmuramoyl-L-alanine amidase
MARTAALLLLVLLAACAPAPLRTTLPSTWRPSPNFDERRPNLVVIHHTSDDTAQRALATLTDPAREVSAHYLVGRDGTIWQLVDERKRAWHAGVSHLGADTDVNSDSIGIELDNDGDEPFPDAQIQSLLALLADIKARYDIPTANFVGHADVAPDRKVDPSRWFPWRALAQHGFGLWCESPPAEPPPGFDAILALQALGYDVSEPGAAIRAFDLHYGEGEGDGSADLTDHAKAVLACLVQEARTTP